MFKKPGQNPAEEQFRVESKASPAATPLSCTRKISALSFFALLTLALSATSLAGGTPDKTWKSPDGSYECYVPKTEDQIERELFVRSVHSHRRVKILNVTRWVEVKWAPDSRYFATVIHWTGHDSAVKVFSIKSSDGTPELSMVYETPPSGLAYVEWKIVTWKMRDRIIVLRQKEETDDKPHYKNSAVEVSLVSRSL